MVTVKFEYRVVGYRKADSLIATRIEQVDDVYAPEVGDTVIVGDKKVSIEARKRIFHLPVESDDDVVYEAILKWDPHLALSGHDAAYAVRYIEQEEAKLKKAGWSVTRVHKVQS